MSIVESQLAPFESLGYAHGIRVVDPTDVHRYRRQFDQVEARVGRARCQTGLFDSHFEMPFVWELATNPVVLDCVEALIGPNILLMGSHFFCKYGPTEAFVAWHQDVAYWGLEPSLAVSAWYAVDDSDLDNGCMQVIAGTHRQGIRAHGKSPSRSTNLLSINQQAPVTSEELEHVVNLELKAGEISLHDGLTIHGSPANRSSRRRCGLAMIYLPTHVKQVGENSLGTRWSALPRAQAKTASAVSRPRFIPPRPRTSCRCDPRGGNPNGVLWCERRNRGRNIRPIEAVRLRRWLLAVVGSALRTISGKRQGVRSAERTLPAGLDRG